MLYAVTLQLVLTMHVLVTLAHGHCYHTVCIKIACFETVCSLLTELHMCIVYMSMHMSMHKKLFVKASLVGLMTLQARNVSTSNHTHQAPLTVALQRFCACSLVMLQSEADFSNISRRWNVAMAHFMW